ncbi:MAG: hypothetical protein ACJ713_19370 [Candidatus Sulfotelmatobacter sp.]
MRKIIRAARASTPFGRHLSSWVSATFPQCHAGIGIHAAPKEAPLTFLTWRHPLK